MKKPHIRKIKGTRYWLCEDTIGRTPQEAYHKWEQWGLFWRRQL